MRLVAKEESERHEKSREPRGRASCLVTERLVRMFVYTDRKCDPLSVRRALSLGVIRRVSIRGRPALGGGHPQ